MSTTSPNFNLILATTSDVVSVTSHLANNFSTLDTVLAVSHTGTGQLKAGLILQAPTLITPTVSGTLTSSVLIASTGRFNTITATGGSIVVNTFSVGTYAIPSTIGASGEILTVLTGNAVWVANAPGTGANAAISNLASVAINTNLNAFTASVVTVTTLKSNTITGTGGTLTLMANVSATTGTWNNLTVTGTVAAGIINCTGGSITAGSLAIGTYNYPTSIGTVGGFLGYNDSSNISFQVPSGRGNVAFKIGSAIDCDFSRNGTADSYGWIISSTTAPNIQDMTSGASPTMFYGSTRLSTEHKVGETVMLKTPAMNTLECYARAWSLVNSNTGAYIRIVVNTVTGVATFLGRTLPTTTYSIISLDISTLANNTYHAVQFWLLHSGTASSVSYTDGVVGFIKT